MKKSQNWNYCMIKGIFHDCITYLFKDLCSVGGPPIMKALSLQCLIVGSSRGLSVSNMQCAE